MNYPSGDRFKKINTALSDLIEESSNIVHLKDAQTEKYIQGSPGFAEKLGLESVNDIIGLTVNDLVKNAKTWEGKRFSEAFIQWRDRQPEIFNNLDRKVKSTKCRVSQETLFFSYEGYISVQNTTKIPIFDQNNQEVIAIYTCNLDVTFQRSLDSMFDLYMEFYPTQQAIQYLLMHLDIDAYFNELPNLEEMKVLFSIHRSANITDETARSIHFFSLQKKIEQDDWQEMLIRLCAVPTI